MTQIVNLEDIRKMNETERTLRLVDQALYGLGEMITFILDEKNDSSLKMKHVVSVCEYLEVIIDCGLFSEVELAKYHDAYAMFSEICDRNAPAFVLDGKTIIVERD